MWTLNYLRGYFRQKAFFAAKTTLIGPSLSSTKAHSSRSSTQERKRARERENDDHPSWVLAAEKRIFGSDGSSGRTAEDISYSHAQSQRKVVKQKAAESPSWQSLLSAIVETTTNTNTIAVVDNSNNRWRHRYGNNRSFSEPKEQSGRCRQKRDAPNVIFDCDAVNDVLFFVERFQSGKF